MIIDLTKFEALPKEFNFVLRSDELDLETELAVLGGEVSVVIRVSIVNSEILAEGEITAPLIMQCGRCLNEIENILNIPFEVRFVDTGALAGQGDLEVAADDLDVSGYADDSLDLIALVREQILLAIPTKFICRETCKGLCRICGGNRNLVDCKCVENETDPRWSALKNIKL